MGEKFSRREGAPLNSRTEGAAQKARRVATGQTPPESGSFSCGPHLVTSPESGELEGALLKQRYYRERPEGSLLDGHNQSASLC